MAKQISAKIFHTIWHPNRLNINNNPLIEHEYHIPEALWVPSRPLQHEYDKVPDYLQNIYQIELAKHDSIEVTDGEHEIKLIPEITAIRIQEDGSNNRFITSVNVGWFDTENICYYGTQYYIDDDIHGEDHRSHLEEHEKSMKPTLHDKPKITEFGPYPLGHGIINNA